MIMRFGVVLKECLNSSNSSVRNFSEVTGLNRGWVYNIFNGKKPLPQEKFQKILSTYPFTANQKKSLRDSYYSDMYGADNFEKIQYIIKSFNNLSNDEFDKIFPDSKKTYTLQSECLNNTESILDAIVYLLSKLSDSKDSFVYTNFSYAQNDINNIFLSLLTNKRNIDFYHLVNFDTMNIDIYNLRNIFCSIPYASLGYTTYYHYNNFGMPLQIDNIFPFFIITNNGVLVYDNFTEEGLILTESSIIDSFVAKVESLFSKANHLVTFNQDLLLLNGQLKKNQFYDDSLIDICFHPCVSYFLDENSIMETASDSIDKEYLDYVISNFLESFYKIQGEAFLFHLDGLKSFVEQKYSPLIPKDFAKSFSTSVVKNILNKIIREYATNKNIYFVDNKVVSFPQDINITTNNTSILISGSLKGNAPQYIGDYNIYLDNSLLAKDFKMFKDFIIQNQYYYNETYTMHFFNNLLISLDE